MDTSTSSTLSAEKMAEGDFRSVGFYGLDPQGAAQAFAHLHAPGDFGVDFVRGFPPMAYDSVTNVWRVFTHDGGWSVKRSIQEEMNDIMAARCAIEAYRIVDGAESEPEPDAEFMAELQHLWENPPKIDAPSKRMSDAEVNAKFREHLNTWKDDKKKTAEELAIVREKDKKRHAKAEKEYAKLRARNMGSNVTRAVVNAQALMDVDTWDFDDMSIGLPQAEQL